MFGTTIHGDNGEYVEMDLSGLSEEEKEIAKDRARDWMAKGCPEPGDTMHFDILEVKS